jgi:putative transcriptional regulator
MKREWLKDIRKELGLTQFEAAKSIGISKSYYNEIEKGKKNPSGSMALRIATLFNFDMSRFYRLDCDTQRFKEVN